MKHGWPLKKVGEPFDVQLGKMLNPRAREGEQFPYLANFNVQWGKFNLGNVKSMHFTESEKGKYSLKQGDLLMCEGGAVGRCAIWNERSTNFYYQKALHRLRPKDNNTINPYFMCIDMEHVTANNGVVKIVGETSIAHLTREKLCALKIPCPSKKQQDKIAKIIRTWDAAIEKTERLIAAKEKQFKWLLKRLISDQQDNPEWRKVRLGEVFGSQLIIEKGIPLKKKEMSRGDFPVIAGGQSYAYSHDKFTHNVDTITISSSGAYAGFVWFHDYPIFATDCNVIRARSGHTKYFYYAIKMQQERIYALQSGGAQPHIYAKDIATLFISIPPVVQQEQIAKTLDITQQRIGLIKQLAEKCRTQNAD